MEMLDIVDENGVPTGETVERVKAHTLGIRHRTAHVWLARKKEGKIQLLLQKRSMEKDSHPGCYDISSAGHIPAGDDYRGSAVRELREELGVQASEADLIPCGLRRFSYQAEFHGRPFWDNQVSRVYLLLLDREETDFHIQKEELESVRWMDMDQCIESVENGAIPNCIQMEELLMVQKKALEIF